MSGAAPGPRTRSAQPDAADVQRVVLSDPKAAHARHLIAQFTSPPDARHFLDAVRQAHPVTPASEHARPALQLDLGITYRGLARLGVPPQVLAQFQLKAPAFAAGAPLCAASMLGDTGPNAAPHWDAPFGIDTAHAVMVMHADAPHLLNQATQKIETAAAALNVRLHQLSDGGRLVPPPGQTGQWVHFGFRDGLSRISVRGWTWGREPTRAVSQHAPGEFILGHVDDAGCNPWALAAATRPVREFFRNGSFGVLRQVQQHAAEFDAYIDRCAAASLESDPKPADAQQSENRRDYILAKLLGRWPDGRRITARSRDQPDPATRPEDDFDYADDPEGLGCPFGAHARRMNPRGGPIAQARHRPLMRRGMPYGPRYDRPAAGATAGVQAEGERGLLGLFFCASIEDQFEHLLGRWADCVPLGSPDRGSAKDPLVGQHENPAAWFEIPGAPEPLARLRGLEAFVRTRGTVYAFFPGLATLDRIITQDTGRLWLEDEPPGRPDGINATAPAAGRADHAARHPSD